MNKPALESIKHKRSTWKNYYYCRTEENYNKFTETRNKATALTKQAKRDYEHNIAKDIKDNSKKLLEICEVEVQNKSNNQ